MSREEVEGCDVCGGDHDTEACPELGLDAPSLPTQSRARLTLPHFAKLVEYSDASHGIVLNDPLAAKTKLGPYEARRTTIDFDVENGFVLKVLQKWGVSGCTMCLDTTSENHCNWMCFIRAAATSEEQNCMAVQIGFELYYTTTRDLNPGAELKVWYAPHYAKKLGKSSEPDGETRVLLGVQLPTEWDQELGCHLSKQTPHAGQTSEDADGSVTCVECGMQFLSQNELIQHTVYHQMLVSKVKNEVGDSITNSCHDGNSVGENLTGVTLEAIAELATPREIHIQHPHNSKGPRKCTRCDQICGSVQELAIHVKKHLMDENRKKQKKNLKDSPEDGNPSDLDDNFKKRNHNKPVRRRRNRNVNARVANSELIQKSDHNVSSDISDNASSEFKPTGQVVVKVEDVEGELVIVQKDSKVVVGENVGIIVNSSERDIAEKAFAEGTVRIDSFLRSPRTSPGKVSNQASSQMQPSVRTSTRLRIKRNRRELLCEKGESGEDGAIRPKHKRNKNLRIHRGRPRKDNLLSAKKKKDSDRDLSKHKTTGSVSAVQDAVTEIYHLYPNEGNYSNKQIPVHSPSLVKTSEACPVSDNQESGKTVEHDHSICEEQNSETLEEEVTDIELLTPEELNKAVFKLIHMKPKSPRKHSRGERDQLLQPVSRGPLSESVVTIRKIREDEEVDIESPVDAIDASATSCAEVSSGQFLDTIMNLDNVPIFQSDTSNEACSEIPTLSSSVQVSLRSPCTTKTVKNNTKKSDGCTANTPTSVAMDSDNAKADRTLSDEKARVTASKKTEIFACEYCGKRFLKPHHLAKHIVAHSDMFRCKDCGRKYARKASLLKHKCPVGLVEGETPQVHICEFCGADFTQAIYLTRHMATHTGEFSCPTCNRAYARKESLLLHLLECDPERMKQEGINCFPCDKCKKVFVKEVSLQNHMKLHTSAFKCELCWKSFSSKLYLDNHVCSGDIREVAIVDGDGPLECKQCGKQFKLEAKLVRHLNLHTSTMQCTICERSFTSKKELMRHFVECTAMLQVESVGEIKCSACDSVFSDAQSFRTHYMEHTHPYRCEQCGRRFLRRSNFESHNCNKDAVEPVACDVCNKAFNSATLLKRHKRIHDDISYTCERCSRTFNRVDYYNDHMCVNDDGVKMRIKRKRNRRAIFVSQEASVCPECGKSYTTRSNLNKHILTHGGKDEMCPVCGKSFHLKVSLKAHLETHTEKYRFQCPHCNKHMKSRNSIYAHIAQFHKEGNTTFPCTECGREFKQKGNLKKHMLVHSPSKSFRCSYCSKDFRVEEQLRKHELWHKHGSRHECDVCSKKFVLERELRWHSAVEHGGTVYACNYCNTICHHVAVMRRHLQRRHADHNEWQKDENYINGLAVKAAQKISEISQLEAGDVPKQLIKPLVVEYEIPKEEAILQELPKQPVMQQLPLILAQVHSVNTDDDSSIPTQTLIIQTGNAGLEHALVSDVTEAMHQMSTPHEIGLDTLTNCNKGVLVPVTIPCEEKSDDFVNAMELLGKSDSSDKPAA